MIKSLIGAGRGITTRVCAVSRRAAFGARVGNREAFGAVG
jgi:hypothetical protein